MRKMPELADQMKKPLMTSAFYGLNENDIISDGELHDMRNFSGHGYPLLKLRRKRGVSDWNITGEPMVPLTGIHGRDQLVFVRGSTIFYNNIPVEGLTLSTAEGSYPKKIVSFGAYVLVWPDLKYFNTTDLTDNGSMNRMWSASGSTMTMVMCRGDGTNYDSTEITPGVEPPADPANGDLWLDESGSNDVLRQWSSATQEWVEVASTFVKVSGNGIGAGLKEYDTIDLSGLELAGEEPDPKIAGQVNQLNASTIVYAAGDDYIVISGLISQAIELEGLTGTVEANLQVPDMDFVCESNNRLWGCKYGLVNGQVVNEIYASKLGDFRNWRNYMGLSTDSYTASVGTDGPWTGCITQRGYPVFFKESAIHRISGMTPSTFQIQTTIARGVQRGSWRSLAVVQENIYYKSRDGVMMYDGNMPVSISEKLGSELYCDARAGVLGDLYYISMMDASGVWHLFNYDTTHGNWWKEDNAHALGFGSAGDDLFYIDEENNTLVSIMGSMGDPEGDIDWMAEFDLYGVHYNAAVETFSNAIRNQSYVSSFKIRMDLDEDAQMALYIQYNDGEWELKGERSGTGIRTFVLPVVPRRCDHVRYKLVGSGGVTVYTISRIMEVGGDGN